jgi:spore maturation protein CgeB
MIRMKVSERFALGQWLSDYPDDKTYDEVLEMITEEHEDVLLWETIENYPPESVIEMIDDTRSSFESSADDLCSGIKLSDVMEGACDE